MYEIKPLEWKLNPAGNYHAYKPGQDAGLYLVSPKDGVFEARHSELEPVCRPIDEAWKFPTLEAAQSACQEHWDARVRECLIDRRADVAALVGAAEEFMDAGPETFSALPSEHWSAKVKLRAAIAALEAK